MNQWGNDNWQGEIRDAWRKTQPHYPCVQHKLHMDYRRSKCGSARHEGDGFPHFCMSFSSYVETFEEVEVELRPTVSRPVRLGVRHPSVGRKLSPYLTGNITPPLQRQTG
jgi:hypothetical protein